MERLRNFFDRDTAFNPDARAQLEKEGYSIYHLTGQSMEMMVHSGRVHNSESFLQFGRKYTKVWKLKSMRTEVAFKANEFFLDKNAKSFRQHQELIDRFSRDISNSIEDVQVVRGSVADYMELSLSYMETTGNTLLRSVFDSILTSTFFI